MELSIIPGLNDILRFWEYVPGEYLTAGALAVTVITVAALVTAMRPKVYKDEMGKRVQYRHADTGRYVSKRYYKRHPESCDVEVRNP